MGDSKQRWFIAATLTLNHPYPELGRARDEPLAASTVQFMPHHHYLYLWKDASDKGHWRKDKGTRSVFIYCSD